MVVTVASATWYTRCRGGGWSTGSREAIEFIAESTLRAGVPFVGYAEIHTRAGALMSVAPNYGEIGTQAGEIVNRIRGGEAPSAIGIHAARAALVTVNKNVARTLGLSVP